MPRKRRFRFSGATEESDKTKETDDDKTFSIRLRNGKRLRVDRTKATKAPKFVDPPSVADDKSSNEIVDVKSDLATNTFQDGVLNYLFQVAKVASDSCKEILSVRAKEYGFDPEAVNTTLKFIRDEADLVIHIHASVLSKLLADTHYRSLFETKSSSGINEPLSRKRWEQSLFANQYDSAIDSERVKYGTLNILQENQGVRACHGMYGSSFLVLKSDVRKRITWTHRDSSQVESKEFGTLESCCHVLCEFSQSLLSSVLNIGSGRLKTASSSGFRYWECQIHGNLKLDLDIASINLSPQDAAKPEIKALAEQFATKNRCVLNLVPL